MLQTSARKQRNMESWGSSKLKKKRVAVEELSPSELLTFRREGAGQTNHPKKYSSRQSQVTQIDQNQKNRRERNDRTENGNLVRITS